MKSEFDEFVIEPGPEEGHFNMGVEELLENRVPNSTKENDKWALNHFNTWLNESPFDFQELQLFPEDTRGPSELCTRTIYSRCRRDINIELA